MSFAHSVTLHSSTNSLRIPWDLQGDPDIGHFYQRPSASFLLLNQQPGFKVGPFTD
jgi:hypothetical protein